jgi:hypothetical protein
MAVDGVLTSPPQDEASAAPITDLRDVTLKQLAVDADARRIASKVVESIEAPSGVRTVVFQSAI